MEQNQKEETQQKAIPNEEGAETTIKCCGV